MRTRISVQMEWVLELLEGEGSMTPRQINNRLYQLCPGRDRRVVAASMARTLRRLEVRGLIERDGRSIAITRDGCRLRSDMQEAVVMQIVEAFRAGAAAGVAAAFREYRESQLGRILWPPESAEHDSYGPC